MTDRWENRDYLRDTQYKTDANLATRQSIYAYQHPRIDLAARVLDLAAPVPSGTVVDVGCGNGMYLAELTRRGFSGRVLGVDLSFGMLAAARDRLAAPGPAGGPAGEHVPTEQHGSTGQHDGSTGQHGPTGPSASRIALANGDATALPVADNAADLAFAMHMLYHVPDPAEALRELRRVTRPGGRVVIVLNGAGHLRELRAAVAAARGEATAARERVRLDDGESMARSLFPRVARHDFTAELRVPGPEPIADYVRSLAGTSYEADPERVARMVAAALPGTADGCYAITSHSGCLVCEVG
jgi:SAM-dependent methyltransferase